MDAVALYVGGYDEDAGAGDREWRLEKRNRISGTLDSSDFGTSGVVRSSAGLFDSEIRTLAIDSTAIYIAGHTNFDGDGRIRVEKRTLFEGELVSDFNAGGILSIDPGTGDDQNPAIALDGTSLYLALGDSSPQILSIFKSVLKNEMPQRAP